MEISSVLPIACRDCRRHCCHRHLLQRRRMRERGRTPSRKNTKTTALLLLLLLETNREIKLILLNSFVVFSLPPFSLLPMEWR